MKISRAQTAMNRQRILTEAARLFIERSISSVGVDAVPGAAGLTYAGSTISSVPRSGWRKRPSNMRYEYIYLISDKSHECSLHASPS